MSKNISKNTYSSAKDILGGMGTGTLYSNFVFHFYDPDEPLANLVIDEQLGRIQNACQERQALQQETLRLLNTQDSQLKSMVTTSLADVNSRIMDYVDQLLAYGPPPPGLEFAIPIYRCLLDTTIASEQFLGEIETASKHSPPFARNELKDMRRAAKAVFIHVYLSLRVFGSPGPEFHPFNPSIALSSSERITVELVCKAKSLGRRLKML
ncbi:hypothetical protein CVT24_013269 [Panaeolus cyanescens]|uniref:Uncharacterized protein n=1 Tax=Panaeolus cyanescens TaxID=181874 RepID=A0A409YN84_9AGAR|nr:hypothetical protein CVT24_013269 [Panaeolus cyanescens]